MTKIVALELNELQDKLFNEHVEYAKVLSSRYPKHFDELYSIALETLFRIIQNKKYDPSKGASFKTYFSRCFSNAVATYFKELAESVGKGKDERYLKDEIFDLENVLDELKKSPVKPDSSEIAKLESEINKLRKELEEASSVKVMPLYTGTSEDDESYSLIDLLKDTSHTAQELAEYNNFKESLHKVLTPQEYDILEMVEQGYKNEEIAEVLRSPSTGEGVSAIVIKRIIPAVQKQRKLYDYTAAHV